MLNLVLHCCFASRVASLFLVVCVLICVGHAATYNTMAAADSVVKMDDAEDGSEGKDERTVVGTTAVLRHLSWIDSCSCLFCTTLTIPPIKIKAKRLVVINRVANQNNQSTIRYIKEDGG